MNPLSFIEQLYKNDGLAYGLNMNISANGFSLKNNVKDLSIWKVRINRQTKLDQKILLTKLIIMLGSIKLYEAAQKTVILKKNHINMQRKDLN